MFMQQETKKISKAFKYSLIFCPQWNVSKLKMKKSTKMSYCSYVAWKPL